VVDAAFVALADLCRGVSFNEALRFAAQAAGVGPGPGN